MAGIIASAVTAEVALTGTTTKTVLQIVAPSNHRLVLKSWRVSFDGKDVTKEPVVVKLKRQTTAGTMSSLTPVTRVVISETLQATAQHTATVEPTSTDTLSSVNVSPTSGYAEQIPIDQPIHVVGGGRLAIECTAPDAVNVIAEMVYEE